MCLSFHLFHCIQIKLNHFKTSYDWLFSFLLTEWQIQTLMRQRSLPHWPLTRQKVTFNYSYRMMLATLRFCLQATPVKAVFRTCKCPVSMRNCSTATTPQLILLWTRREESFMLQWGISLANSWISRNIFFPALRLFSSCSLKEQIPGNGTYKPRWKLQSELMNEV